MSENEENKVSIDEISTYSYKQQVYDIINTLDLKSETERNILKSRFLGEVLSYEDRRNHTKKYYNVFRFLVTTGSILLPAILSMGQMDPAKLPKNFENVVYWTSWSISLMVTACNGFLQLFSLDKNYFEYALTTEQLKTEGWQFFQLSGKYDEYPDHASAYRPFCKSIENIKRKQVEKEFSGKGEVKKKKEFNFQKELEKALPGQFSGGGQPSSAQPPLASSPATDILSMLSKLTPDKIQEVSRTLGEVPRSVTDVVKDTTDSMDPVKESGKTT